jgi:serine protease Do
MRLYGLRPYGLRIVCCSVCLVLAATCLLPGSLPAVADEAPSALAVTAAMEEVLEKAIAASEKSIVAIARVRRESDRVDDVAASVFNQSFLLAPPSPDQDDFIPNEYATGVVVGADGLILTAHHVLREDSDYWVTTAAHKTYKVAKIVGADPRSDLAVLQIEASDLVPIKFGDTSQLKRGQIVIALGNPYAIARDGQASASWGIISNLGRKDRPWSPRRSTSDDVPITKPTLHQYGSLIQTDARLNLGTSGGALLNRQGEMIGLTVALAASLGHEQSAGFAIPADETFLRAVQTLKQGREVEYGFLGIMPQQMQRDDHLHGKHGIIVQQVVAGTPAERAGLVHSDIITHIDGHEVFEKDDLMYYIGRLPADASVRLIVERDGKTRQIVVNELSKNHVWGRKIITTPSPAWRGIRVDYVTASSKFTKWIEDRRGDLAAVLITEVEENSPAWTEGLRPDMMISHVGGTSVTTPKAFFEAIAGQDGPVRVRLSLPDDSNAVRTIPPAG